MSKVRFGVIGLGNMGSSHARWIAEDKGNDLTLGAVCDIVEEKARKVGEQFGVSCFTDAREMYDSGEIDAVIIAVPHYWHAPLTIRAARKGIHVLCEKPLESRVSRARAMIAECRRRKVAFGAMLQQRTRPAMIKMKQMVDAGKIGDVFRVQMICSNWFRTQAYYDSGSWRGTWDGEGGGVLINQAPHSLDLFQWIGLGLPQRVQALVSTRDHDIEVEDTANVLCDYGEGKVGYIYATTAEEPGMEQLMVCGDKGTLIAERNALRWGKLKQPVSKHIRGSKSAMGGAAGEQETTWSDVKIPQGKSGHIHVIRAFAAHLLRGKKMVATAEEAINELELSNAAYVAGYKGRAVDLPVKDTEIDRLIARLERERSTGKGQGLRTSADRDFRRLMRGK